MWSTNSANAAGRKIGREFHDVWVDDHQLMAVVKQEIIPQIKLRRSFGDDGEGEGARTAGIMFLFVAVIGLAVTFLSVFYYDAVWFPHELENLPAGVVGLGSVSLIVLGVTLIIFARRAAADASQRRADEYSRLVAAAYNGAQESLARRRAETGMPVQAVAQPKTYRPAPRFHGVTPREAEELAAEWMRYLGAHDAQVTQFAGDGGMDVISARYVAQVKHYNSSIGVAPVRELAGVVRVDGRRGLFFATNSFSPGAVQFASSSGLALFRLYPEGGEITAINATAAAFLRHGL